MSVMANNAANAAMAFRQATEDAGNYIDSLMQQYGWAMPGTDGQYSTIAAGDAFDPNNIMSFNETTGVSSIDAAKVAQATSGSQMVGKGIFSDILRSGGAAESGVIQAMRGRNIAGGLAGQQRALAEATTQEQSAKASSDLLRAILGQYGGVRGAFSNLAAARVAAATSGAQTGAQYV